jgi:hypothetical protein
MPSKEFAPAIPAVERPQTNVLDRTGTGIGLFKALYLVSWLD